LGYNHEARKSAAAKQEEHYIKNRVEQHALPVFFFFDIAAHAAGRFIKK
jgi:hypothetical protein